MPTLRARVAWLDVIQSFYDGDNLDTNIYGGDGSLTLNEERIALRYHLIENNDYLGKIEMLPSEYTENGVTHKTSAIHIVNRTDENKKMAEFAIGVPHSSIGSYEDNGSYAYLKTYGFIGGAGGWMADNRLEMSSGDGIYLTSSDKIVIGYSWSSWDIKEMFSVINSSTLALMGIQFTEAQIQALKNLVTNA